MDSSRRDFLRTSAAVAGSVAAAELLHSNAEATPGGLPKRVLGRTKERVSLIGFGLAPLGSDNTTPDEAARIVNFALDSGITYLDVAPVYGDPNSKYGNAEMKLKEVCRARRKDFFLVTKVNPGSGQTRDGVLRQLEKSLKDIGTDHADAVHIHNLGDWDMDRLFKPDGAVAGLKEARKQGLVRFIGTSGHMRPPRFVQAIETGDIDLVMNAYNFADRNHYDFEGLVLPAAKKQGTAVVAMKVLGGAVKWAYDARTPGCFAAKHELAIRYSLGLPGVACAVIGFANEGEIRKAVEVARAWKPLSREERAALLDEGKKIADSRGLYYGPVTG
jgi:aryl-alcohol dehydrogenase-like predicted oxidoreductase